MSSGPIYTGTIASSLKLTLEKIIDDNTDGYEKNSDYKKWVEEGTMKDNWVDDLEMGGPAFLSIKPEGQEISTGSLQEGARTRYIADTYAMKLTVTEEAMEDKKYEDSLNLARRLKLSCYQTVDSNTTQMLVDGFNTAKPGADGQPLWSASHTLPNGGTFSNLAAAPAAPSVAALTVIISQIKKLVGHNGVTMGYRPKQVLAPTEQWGDWSSILKSDFEPVTNNFANINVVKREFTLGVSTLKFWDNTTSNWAVQTDVPDQMQILWRRKPRTRTWVDNGQENMLHSISSRWATGWSDPRNSIGINV